MEQRMWNIIIHGKIKGNPQLYAHCHDFEIQILQKYPTSIHIEKNN